MSLQNNLKTLVSLNTKDRKDSTETSSDCLLHFPHVRNVVSFEVESASIPNTVFNVNANNKNIYWEDSLSLGITSVIDEGNYTITELLAKIGTQMTTDASDGLTYEAEEVVNSEKVTIDNTVATNFELTTTNTNNAMWDMLGYNTDANKTGAGTYTGDNVFYIQYTHDIQVFSDIVSRMDDRSHASDGNRKTLLVKVNRDREYGSTLYDEPNSRRAFRYTDDNVGSIRLTLKDDNGDSLSLNGRDYIVNLLFHHAHSSHHNDSGVADVRRIR